MTLDSTTLWDLVEQRAALTPDAEMAVDEQGQRLTFGEYRRRCEEVAAGLHADHGITTDTRVSWMLPTWLDAMVLMGALSRLGAVQNPILHIYREREVGFALRQSQPALIVVPFVFGGFDFAAMAKDVCTDLSTEVLVADRGGLPSGDPSTLPPAPPVPATDEDLPVRWIFYTSGTTSEPKGALHTDAALRGAGIGMSEALHLDESDRFAFVFPITHIAGGVYLWSAMAYGTSFILDPSFNPATTIPLLRDEGVTQAGAGTVFHQMYLAAQRELPDGEQLFPDVKCFPGGGAPRPPTLHRDLKDAFGVGVVSGYGLTEAPIIVMAHIDHPDDVLASTEGPAVPGAELKLVDLDGSVVGPGEEGEIRVKGLQVTRGYLDASLDADAFDADGWFRTGDLGIVDDRGMLSITGRLKDVIIRKGETISAKDVEDVLHTHDGVADVAVIGLPDDERGELVCAVVVATDPAAPPSTDDLLAHCATAGLMQRRHPERFEFVDALPRNMTGKILKHELQAAWS